MVEMYEKYGYYKDEVKSIGLKGIEGLAKLEIMEYSRPHRPILPDIKCWLSAITSADTVMISIR